MLLMTMIVLIIVIIMIMILMMKVMMMIIVKGDSKLARTRVIELDIFPNIYRVFDRSISCNTSLSILAFCLLESALILPTVSCQCRFKKCYR